MIVGKPKCVRLKLVERRNIGFEREERKSRRREKDKKVAREGIEATVVQRLPSPPA